MLTSDATINHLITPIASPLSHHLPWITPLSSPHAGPGCCEEPGGDGGGRRAMPAGDEAPGAALRAGGGRAGPWPRLALHLELQPGRQGVQRDGDTLQVWKCAGKRAIT